MAIYRIDLRYENPRCESTSFVRAKDMKEAEAMCLSMMRLERQRLEALEGKNIFVSKRLVGCSASEESEDNVKLVDDHGDLILPAGDVELLSPRAEPGQPRL